MELVVSTPRIRRAAGLLSLILLLGSLLGCAVVPQNRRRYLADPTMQPTESPLESKAMHKFHQAREGAGGGDGEPAGGGCGCSN